MNLKYNSEELYILQKSEANQLKISKTRKIDLTHAVKTANATIENTSELRIYLSEKDRRKLKLKEIGIKITIISLIISVQLA